MYHGSTLLTRKALIRTSSSLIKFFSLTAVVACLKALWQIKVPQTEAWNFDVTAPFSRFTTHFLPLAKLSSKKTSNSLKSLPLIITSKPGEIYRISFLSRLSNRATKSTPCEIDLESERPRGAVRLSYQAFLSGFSVYGKWCKKGTMLFAHKL